MTYRPDWPPSQYSSQPHGLETERRLTRLEVTSEGYGETLEEIGETVETHADKHQEQAVWNRGFTVALAGLGAGLAHAKAPEIVGLLLTLLARLKP